MAAKKGTKHHGILDLLARHPNGLRQMDIGKKFRLTGCSTLTTMRRQDLIKKGGEKLTTPWLITEKGKQVLSTLGPFTMHCARCGVETDGIRCDKCLQDDAQAAASDLSHPEYDDPTVYEWRRNCVQ